MVGWTDSLHDTAIYPGFFNMLSFLPKDQMWKLSEDTECLRQSGDTLWHKKAKYSEISGMPTAAIPVTQAPELCVCTHSDACEQKCEQKLLIIKVQNLKLFFPAHLSDLPG